MPATPHVVLVGLMGSGKSSIGEPLAARLGRPYVDNDDELERRTGRSAREIADADGIERLHAEESSALLDALRRVAPSVLGAAASVVEAETVRDALRGHTVVWLDVDVERLARKLRKKAHRPYADRDALELLTAQYAVRAPLYRGIASFVVDPGDRSDAVVADEIAKLVQ